MLPHKDLAPLYDQAIWVYVYRDFTKSPADLAAERISIRCGVSSWPQLMLIDPISMKRVARAGRTVQGMKSAFAKARLAPNPGANHRGPVAQARLKRSEQTAIELQTQRDRELAHKVLFGEEPTGAHDIVPQTRALEVLAERTPDVLVEKAATLLRTPNDPFRYLVCQMLRTAGDAKAAPHLEALVKNPEPSLNPNVVRIRAVQALATCGRPESVKVIAPHATTGNYFNGLTGAAVDTLAAIAKRHPKAAAEVAAALRKGYPTVPKEDPGTKGGMRKHRAATHLARRIHKAVADPRPFPTPYDDAARTLLMKGPGAGK